LPLPLGLSLFLGILSLGVFLLCPYHPNLRDVINFTISATCNIPCIFLYVITLFRFVD
jgi:hypothetical protein